MCDARIPQLHPIFLDINKFYWWFWFFDQQKTSFLLVKWPCLARNRRHPEFCTRIVGSRTSRPDAKGDPGHLGHLSTLGPGALWCWPLRWGWVNTWWNYHIFTTGLPHIYPYNLVKYLVKLPHVWGNNHPLSAFNSYSGYRLKVPGVWLMDLQID